MESSNNNTGLKVALIIFIVLTLLLTGFIATDKFAPNNKDEKTVENKETKKDNEVNNSICDSYKIFALEPIHGYAVLYNNQVYVNVYDSTLNIDEVYGNNKYQSLLASRNTYKEYNFGNLSIDASLIGTTSKWMKLDISDITNIYNNNYGQALSSFNPKYGIILTTKNNEVYYISTSDLIDGKTVPVKLEYNNISKVVTLDADGATTYLVNSNGEKTDVNTLIK